MKKIIYIIIVSLLVNCVHKESVRALSKDKTVIYYYDLEYLDEARRPIVLEAMRHMESSVSCLAFEPVAGPSNKLILFISVRKLPNSVVGLSTIIDNTPTIMIVDEIFPPYNHAGRLPDDFYFKVVMHELVHQFGMWQHTFPETDSNKTHLAAQVSFKSPKVLFKNDVQYIENLVCGTSRI